MTSHSRKPVIAAGIALTVLPLLAVVLKLAVYPGWMMLVILIIGIPLGLGYIIQVLIASIGMFRARGVFNRLPQARRGLTAAWVTSAGVLLAVFFLIDGGDSGGYGSAFTEILGISSTPQGEQLSTILFTIVAIIWVASWVWLVVEWILLMVKARREARTPRFA